MEELPDDPISAVFALNQEMVSRVPRIGAIVEYAYWAGIIITILSAMGSLIFWLENHGLDLRLLAAAALVISPVFSWFARRERQFLSEYHVLASAVNRAKDWEPEPEIPEGEEPLDRLIEFLKGQDERFAYLYEKRPKCLKSPYRGPWRLSEESEYLYDAYFECTPYPWYRIHEGLRLFIKVLPLVDVEDVEEFLEATKEMIDDFDGNRLPVRAALLQTDSGEFDDDLIEYVEENGLEYYRRVGTEEWEWNSPIELIAEDPEGHYNLATLYWG